MQITSVTTRLAYGGRQTWVFVVVETDAGITGVGEASVEGKEQAVCSAVADLSRPLLGRDARRIEHNWQILYRHGFWRGGIVLDSALSGIEQALWDIAGKDLGVPVYRLLGGACRDRIQLYTHCGGATPEDLAARAKELVDRGWGALKIGCPGPELYANERRWLDAIDERLGVLRGAVGQDVQVMMDAHGRLTAGQAIRLLHVLKPWDLAFLEEPVPPENVDELMRVS
ncbi:MAG: galactonate dehydratase, partial [Chloroflexi bacterium]|nr:galactonate dehydratase [Chloroflexota bacterium]